MEKIAKTVNSENRNSAIIVNDVNVCPWQMKWDVLRNNPRLALKQNVDIKKLLMNGFGKKDPIYHDPIETLAKHSDGFEVPADIRFFDKHGNLKPQEQLQREILKYYVNGKNTIKVLHAPYEESPFHYYKFNILEGVYTGDAKQKLDEFMFLQQLASADVVMHLGRIQRNAIHTNTDVSNLETKISDLTDLILDTVEKRPKKSDKTFAKFFFENMPFDPKYHYIGSKLDEGKRKEDYVKSLPHFLDKLKGKFEKRGYKNFGLYFGICFDLSHALSVTEHQEYSYDINAIRLCINRYHEEDVQMIHLAGHKRPASTPLKTPPFLYDNHTPIKTYIESLDKSHQRGEYTRVIKEIIETSINNNQRLSELDNGKKHTALIHIETQLANLYGFPINPNGLKTPQEIYENIDFVRDFLKK